MSNHYDMEPEFLRLHEQCRHATMTSIERMYSLYQAVKYIAQADIPGDIVECGVWRGGSMMMVALSLLAMEDSRRVLHLFDTYEGMPQAGRFDVMAATKISADQILRSAPRRAESLFWAIAPLDEVRSNMDLTGYPPDLVRYVPGMVEETLPAAAPAQIAILRLDTDWYESTKHELENLFPRLADGGVLIVDDYGFWQGARKAVDEYFLSSNWKILLNRVDDTGRVGVKRT